jgi:hypothetical protein
MRRSLVKLFAAAVLVAAVHGCAPDRGEDQSGAQPSPTVSAACDGKPASSVRLGSPYRTGRPATFRTNGDPIYLTAHQFEHGGLLDPATGITAFYIGPAQTPPSYDERTGQVTPATATLLVKEREYGQIQLNAGSYWLWTTTGGDVELISCTPEGVGGG